MASYRGHLAFSSLLGAAVGGVGWWQLHLDWGAAVLAGGLTALGGLLPDLDSDSSVPVREVFGLAAAAVAFLAQRPLEHMGLTLEQRLVVAGGLYLFVRYGLRWLFGRLTVHRGMFHSIPALCIAGLTVFLLDHGSDLAVRAYLAAGTAVGFLSHLVLDALYGIDLMGHRLRTGKHAGGPLKLVSPSWTATGAAYMILAGLAYLTWQEVAALQESRHFL
jgi:hypothetical protein